MTSGEAAPEAPPGAQRWHDALKALWAFALDPVLLGGVWVRAPHGPVRDRWLAELTAVGGPGVRIPTHVDDERLMGGLDLSASLRSGSAMVEASSVESSTVTRATKPASRSSSRAANRRQTCAGSRVAAAISSRRFCCRARRRPRRSHTSTALSLPPRSLFPLPLSISSDESLLFSFPSSSLGGTGSP